MAKIAARPALDFINGKNKGNGKGKAAKLRQLEKKETEKKREKKLAILVRKIEKKKNERKRNRIRKKIET